MAENELEASDIERKVHDLAEAMGRARAAQADRDDVVVEMKHAKLSRLELLHEELADVRKNIPENAEQFEFALTNGNTPRLWVDMTSFVRMAADGREYEFVKDTRLGRKILGRSVDRQVIGIAITDYVAERLLERERIIEGDWIVENERVNSSTERTEAEADDENSEAAQKIEKAQAESQHAEKQSGSSGIFWFMLGIAVSAGFVVAVVALDKVDPVLDWIKNITG